MNQSPIRVKSTVAAGSLFGVLAGILALGPSIALAQPFIPVPPVPFGPFGPPRLPRPPFVIPRVVVVPPVPAPVVVSRPAVVVGEPTLAEPSVTVTGPGIQASVTVEVSPARAAEAILRIRQRVREELAARRQAALALGDALLLGMDVELRAGSFFRLEDTHPNLQVAILIDGTDSMGRDLDSLKQTLAAIAHRFRAVKPDGQVEFAFVVYRDTGVVAKSGGRIAEVTSPVNEFTSDTSLLVNAIRNQRVATGEPYFEELVDEGLYQTLTRLNWRADATTSRWILLCGDAPPYPETNPMRRYGDSTLIRVAQERGVTVHSILCRSGFLPPFPQSNGWDVAKTSDQLRPRLQSFMSQVSANTGGQFLDLSDPAALEVLVAIGADNAPRGERPLREPVVTQPDSESPVEELPPPLPSKESPEGDEAAPPAEPAPPVVKIESAPPIDAGPKIVEPKKPIAPQPIPASPTEPTVPPRKYRSALTPAK